MVDEKSMVIIVVAGTLLMFVLILAIIMFVALYNRKLVVKETEHKLQIKDKELEMLRSIIEAQETEREKIARNLHDEVGPLLSTLKLNISRFKKSLQKEKLSISDLDAERAFIDKIIENVRTVSHDLSPQFLLKFGLVKAIENYVKPYSNIHIKITSDFEESKIDKQIIVNTYRIVLELLNNAFKHDNPTTLHISFSVQNQHLILKIGHNGVGITNEQFSNFAENSAGLGLSSMQSRVLIVNGKLHFDTTQDAKIELKIPI